MEPVNNVNEDYPQSRKIRITFTVEEASFSDELQGMLAGLLDDFLRNDHGALPANSGMFLAVLVHSYANTKFGRENTHSLYKAAQQHMRDGDRFPWWPFEIMCDQYRRQHARYAGPETGCTRASRKNADVTVVDS